MLEREQDLATCLATLHEVANGHGRFLVIEGPAGIGKTALLRAFLDAAPDNLRILSARATELDRDLPFGSVRQLFQPILVGPGRRRVERLFRGAATVTRQLIDPDSGGFGTSDPYAMLHGLYWLTSELAEQQPLVLAIDDAHWLDLPSVRFLSFIQPRVAEMPLLVVLATRPLHDEPDEDGLARILADPDATLVRPQPLSREAVAVLVRDEIGQTGLQATDDIASMTGGNPFYLVELLRDVRATGAAQPAALRRIGPRSIAQAIRFRGRGSSEAIAFARSLAVLGDGARIQDVAALADLDLETAPGVADAMIADEVLATGPNLGFSHPIVRTAVYEDIGPREREVMHQRAARLLHARGGDADRIALQLLATAPDADPWVVDVLRDAAEAARNRGAPDVAVRYLRRAHEEPPDGSTRSDVLLELGRAEESIGNHQAGTHFLEAYDAVSTPAERARAAIAASFAFAASGDSQRSIEMLEVAAMHVDALPRESALELEARIAMMASFQQETAVRHLT
ncbi:MAG TPA: AAA family ATPase, partial [Gaiellaceae bacterium]|nr:AAA family ATPase [Gaiellaceae bacterium]